MKRRSTLREITESRKRKKSFERSLLLAMVNYRKGSGTQSPIGLDDRVYQQDLYHVLLGSERQGWDEHGNGRNGTDWAVHGAETDGRERTC